MELAFTTFYYSSHLGLVGALESVANYQDFLGLKRLIFFTLLLLLFFLIIFLFKVQEVNVNEACIR